MNRAQRSLSVLLVPTVLFVAEKVAAAEETKQVSPAVPQVPTRSPAAQFGAQGELAISTDNGLSISNTSTSGGGGSTTSIVVRPSADYFIIDHLSLGAFLDLNYTHTPGGHSTSFAIGPRIGYDIPLSPLFSVWGKLGLSFRSVSQTVNGQAGLPSDTRTSSNLALNLFVPFMVHPAEHFFFGFGPALDVDLSGSIKSTTIGGDLTVGGYF